MGFDFIDENLLRIIEKLNVFFSYQTEYESIVRISRALAAVFVLVVIASEAYQVMLLKKQFDFLVIARPIFIGIVISAWAPFTSSILDSVPKALTSYSKNIFTREVMKTQDLRKTRFEKADELFDKTMTGLAAAENSSKQLTNPNMWDKVVSFGTDMLNNVAKSVEAGYIFGNSFLSQYIEKWIFKLASIFWQVSIALLLFSQQCFIGIMKLTGPITFAISILPTYKDAWSQWIARYISVSLYGFIAYLFLAAAMQLMKYGIEMDIKVLTSTVSTHEIFISYIKQNNAITSLSMVIILIIGGFSMKLVPEVASWIFPTSTVMGASSFMSGISSSVKKTATFALGAITKVK